MWDMTEAAVQSYGHKDVGACLQSSRKLEYHWRQLTNTSRASSVQRLQLWTQKPECGRCLMCMEQDSLIAILAS